MEDINPRLTLGQGTIAHMQRPAPEPGYFLNDETARSAWSGPSTQHYRIDEGSEFLLVKRATGPEIIAVAPPVEVLMSVTQANG